MRNFNFKTKGSVIRTVKEPIIKKKKMSLDRLTYLGVVCFIAFISLRFTYLSLNVINGNGQIVFKKTAVKFTDDIRIDKFFVIEGSKVKKGDTLFTYHVEKERENATIIMQGAESRSKIQRDVLAFEKEILMRETKLTTLQVNMNNLRIRYDQMMELVLLEVKTKVALDNLKLEKNNLVAQIQQVKLEIEGLKKIKNQYRTIGNSLLASYRPSRENFYYISPVDGISGTINFVPKEVCYRQQDVLTIHDSKTVSIKAYFGQKHAKQLKPNTLMKIHFQDGSSSMGRIESSYVSTYALPSEFQKKYEPTERNIVLDLVPISHEDEAVWRKLYLMDVKLEINRWKFYN